MKIYKILGHDLQAEPKHGLFAKCEYCVDHWISCSVSYSHSKCAATSYSEVYVPTLQKMPKIFPIHTL
jgi:hypothetical protein